MNIKRWITFQQKRRQVVCEERAILNTKDILIYHSRLKDIEVVNNNKKVVGDKNKPIVCRHIAYYMYETNIKNPNHLAQLNSVVDCIGSKQGSIDKNLKEQNSFKNYFEFNNFWLALFNVYQRDSINTKNLSYLLFSLNHTMAINVKSDHKSIIKVKIYDPNETNIAYKIISTKPKNIMKLDPEMLPISNYFINNSTGFLQNFRVDMPEQQEDFTLIDSTIKTLGWAIRSENIAQVKRVIDDIKLKDASSLAGYEVPQTMVFSKLSYLLSDTFCKEYLTLCNTMLGDTKALQFMLHGKYR